MRYLSVCSGIEAATVAWHPLGWVPAAFSEIEAFPRAVLAHHYPAVPLHGDFTTIGPDDYGAIDLLVGGTPCQDFSVAGLRAGIAGERGNLTLEFLRLAARKKPRWIVWENVPGVLSIDGGRTFGAVLGGLAELGYGFAYRVLDAQYFGLAQRRARVFVVGYLGDWRCAAAVLFEQQSLHWDPAPRREAGQRVAPAVTSGAPNGGAAHGARSGSAKKGLIAEVAGTLPAKTPHADGHGREDLLVAGTTMNGDDVFPTLDAQHDRKWGSNQWVNNGFGGIDAPPVVMSSGMKNEADFVVPAVAFMENQRGELRTDNVTDSLKGSGGKPGQGYQAVAFLHEAPIVAFGGNNTAGPIEVATAVNAHGGPHGRLDFERETFIAHAFDARQSGVLQYGDITGPLDTGQPGPAIAFIAKDCDQDTVVLAHTLSTQCGAATEDGTGRGRGSPIVPVHVVNGNSTPETSDDLAFPLRADDGSAPALTCLHEAPIVAFDLHGSPASEIASETDVHTPLRARVPGLPENSTTTVVATAFKPSHFTRGKDGAPDEVVPPLSADADKGDQDTLVHICNGNSTPEVSEGLAFPLRADDGSGNRQVIAAPIPFDPRQIHHPANFSHPKAGDVCHPLRAVANAEPAIAFTVKDHGADAGPLAPTLRAGGHDGSHANGGVMPAVAFAQNQCGEVREGDVFNTNSNASGRNTPLLKAASAVRRLTPRECERLQGFPDDYTLVPFRKKPAADGPRYRALGNSMAVPVMRWIGERIDMVERIARESEAAT